MSPDKRWTRKTVFVFILMDCWGEIQFCLQNMVGFTFTFLTYNQFRQMLATQADFSFTKKIRNRTDMMSVYFLFLKFHETYCHAHAQTDVTAHLRDIFSFCAEGPRYYILSRISSFFFFGHCCYLKLWFAEMFILQ